MSNMSYCRFQNTLDDLIDCYDATSEMPDASDLSDDERRAAAEMVRLCADFAAEYAEFFKDDN